MDSEFYRNKLMENEEVLVDLKTAAHSSLLESAFILGLFFSWWPFQLD